MKVPLTMVCARYKIKLYIHIDRSPGSHKTFFHIEIFTNLIGVNRAKDI